MNISQFTISEIKKIFSDEFEISEELVCAAQRDSRLGVKNIYKQYYKQKQKLENELLRIKTLQKYEDELYAQGHNYIAGVDEAGRGPLAGPVVAGAVILPKEARIIGINDSKKLSPEKREELAAEIKEKALAWSVGVLDTDFIDTFNILQASLKAMFVAINNLRTSPNYILVDAVTIPHIQIPQIPIIGGDGLSISIAAASIIAKTTRDEMMLELHERYPEYGFDKHKGYGTAEHYIALRKYGPCPIHRISFNLVKESRNNAK